MWNIEWKCVKIVSDSKCYLDDSRENRIGALYLYRYAYRYNRLNYSLISHFITFNYCKLRHLFNQFLYLICFPREHCEPPKKNEFINISKARHLHWKELTSNSTKKKIKCKAIQEFSVLLRNIENDSLAIPSVSESHKIQL